MMTAMSALYCGETTKTSVSSDICSQRKENYTSIIIIASIAIMITMVLITTMNITITWALG